MKKKHLESNRLASGESREAKTVEISGQWNVKSAVLWKRKKRLLWTVGESGDSRRDVLQKHHEGFLMTRISFFRDYEECTGENLKKS
jgi:hypothetical protein